MDCGNSWERWEILTNKDTKAKQIMNKRRLGGIPGNLKKSLLEIVVLGGIIGNRVANFGKMELGGTTIQEDYNAA